jgi:hypothetical protein
LWSGKGPCLYVLWLSDHHTMRRSYNWFDNLMLQMSLCAPTTSRQQGNISLTYSTGPCSNLAPLPTHESMKQYMIKNKWKRVYLFYLWPIVFFFFETRSKRNKIKNDVSGNSIRCRVWFKKSVVMIFWSTTWRFGKYIVCCTTQDRYY